LAQLENWGCALYAQPRKLSGCIQFSGLQSHSAQRPKVYVPATANF
jgi:hypothetical protein